VTAVTESGRDRDKRHYQRALFDGIAERYAASRPGYPAHVVDFITTTAGLAPAAAVLEVGCGTGQLTRQLARRGFQLTAIDIGPSMIATARRHLTGAEVLFQVTSFEDLAAADASFDLVISSAAFHWIDPEVAFSKSARLLRPDGREAGHDAGTRRHLAGEHQGDIPELAIRHPVPFHRGARPAA
jgi:2-polyprenyl-3-methyl-5-hydroxy-6-metoxy-1,4-benzoquinol methylase